MSRHKNLKECTTHNVTLCETNKKIVKQLIRKVEDETGEQITIPDAVNKIIEKFGEYQKMK